MTAPLFACAGCHAPQPGPGHRCPSPPEGRVIPGGRIRAASAYLLDRGDELLGFTCAERVLVALGALLASGGIIDGADLAAATTEPDTVDLALHLLAEAGLHCA